MFSQVDDLAIHGKRVTIKPGDIHIWGRIDPWYTNKEWCRQVVIPDTSFGCNQQFTLTLRMYQSSGLILGHIFVKTSK